MKKKEDYLNIKSSYVKIIFSILLLCIVISIGLTVTLYSLYSQYIEGKFASANQIIFGVNTGILCLLLITIIVLLPIVFMASKKMATPLVEMKKVAIAMSEGDFSIRAKDNYNGEIGQLALTLNQLSTELSKTINALTIEGDLLKQIINSMSDGLLELDVNQNVNLMNKTFQTLFGIDTQIEELERDILKAIYNVSLSAINHSKTRTVTCSFEDKSILISASPIRAEQNSIVGTVLLFRDITEAERLEQTRRDYVANVSHELRSPLTAVKGLIIPLKEGMVKDDDKKKHFYEVIYNEIERLNRLVNDLFELSRLQSRKCPFEINTVDMQKILFDQKDKFEMLAEEKGIKLIVQESDESVLAKGNIDRINQVLAIFIDNALKFADEGSQITLYLKKEKDKALVFVDNTGSFIKHEDLIYVFDRFYKADKIHLEQGAGLGLSIAKEIIMRMNGEVYAKSDNKNETSFSFELELVE